MLQAQSTDKLLLISSDGRGYLLPVERLPGGRGQGEPLRLQIDLGRGAEPVMLAVHRPDGRVLLASSAARGFIAEEAAMAAQTRAGKQVLNLDEGERLVVACPAEGDHVATVGSNHKLLLFPIDELPVMSRGKGVLLQRYRGGSLADACVITPRRRPLVAGRPRHPHGDRAHALARATRPDRPRRAARLPAQQPLHRLTARSPASPDAASARPRWSAGSVSPGGRVTSGPLPGGAARHPTRRALLPPASGL